MGFVSVLIPNKFFGRMTPILPIEYVFFIITSVLLGTYISFHLFQKKSSNKACSATAYSGGAMGFMGFGCVFCNKILLLLLGATGVANFIQPYKPLFGSVGVALMGFAVYRKGKGLDLK